MKLITTRPKHLRAIQWDGQPIKLNDLFSVANPSQMADGNTVGVITWNEMPIEGVIKNQWIVIGDIGPRGYAVFNDEIYHANFEECNVVDADIDVVVATASLA